MKVLVACEYSGRVRDAFIARGHNAMSCDLLPSELPGPHYQGDIADCLDNDWDLMIAHPPCTYLANSGVRWLHENPKRWPEMFEAADFFLSLLNAPIPRIAVENPVQHKYARRLIGIGHTQTVQPWQFGDGFTKRTCFWLKGLPALVPTKIVDGRKPECHYASPGKDRWKERSRTYPGIADAMASQWGATMETAA